MIKIDETGKTVVVIMEDGRVHQFESHSVEEDEEGDDRAILARIKNLADLARFVAPVSRGANEADAAAAREALVESYLNAADTGEEGTLTVGDYLETKYNFAYGCSDSEGQLESDDDRRAILGA